MKLEVRSGTDCGRVRKANEDFFNYDDEGRLAILCDGMGGHQSGAEASELAVRTIGSYYHHLSQNEQMKIARGVEVAHLNIAAPLVSGVRLANRCIYNRAQQDPDLRGMGTTVVAMRFSERLACICHVGDSRIYRFRDGKIARLTEDHSWVNELIQDHEIAQEEALQFKSRNVITRALGLNPSVKIDLIIEPVKKHDLFLLCTDGLTNALSDDEIRNIVDQHSDDLRNAVEQLIDNAIEADGSDNITVCLIRVLKTSKSETSLSADRYTLREESPEISHLEDHLLRDASKPKKPEMKSLLYWAFAAFLIIALSVYFVARQFVHANRHFSGQTVVQLSADNDRRQAEDAPVLLMKSRDPVSQTHPAQSGDSSTFDLRSQSLNRTSQHLGQVHLLGFEKFKQKGDILIYINQNVVGALTDFMHRAIEVKPGRIEITLREANGAIVYQQSDIWVSPGDIKVIEMDRR